MCGIAGIFLFNNDGRISESILTAMRDTMRHRGPDGGANWINPTGQVGLAHRRLSIVDLSTAASQPMPNENGRVMVVFNGEIWNHLALRKELLEAGHRFHTDHSDTEVIVHGYEQWGFETLLKRLDGDFSIAVWDENEQQLCLARDRVGIKPLYFTSQKDAFIFASEIKAIVKHSSVECDIDPLAMYHYLSFMVTPAPMTMFNGIFKLPAGFYLQIRRNSFEARRYWDAVPGRGIDPLEIKGMSEADLEKFYIKGINSRLYNAVEKRMMSDVPFGVFLSGGVDSSTNVALMSQMMNRPVDTFTVGFKDYERVNELEHANLIARLFKTNHREILIGERDMMGFLDDLIYHQDEPLADWVCIPLYYVSKLAKQSGVTVVQVGEGSDEQFCGYSSYMKYLRLKHRYYDPFRRIVPRILQQAAGGTASFIGRMRPPLRIYADLVNRAVHGREHFWTGAMSFWETMKTPLINKAALSPSSVPELVRRTGLLPESYLKPDSFNVVASFFDSFDRRFPGQDALTRMIYSEFKLRLSELLLMRVDKMTMATSVEARVPFLDQDLVEFTMGIPEAWKTRKGEPKYLLKKAVEGLIPHDIIYRKKMGFEAPMSEWLRGPFGKYVASRMFGSRLMDRGYFRRAEIEYLISAHRTGKADFAVQIWTLFNLFAWYDRWIEGA